MRVTFLIVLFVSFVLAQPASGPQWTARPTSISAHWSSDLIAVSIYDAPELAAPSASAPMVILRFPCSNSG
jgi:hypothetical protein